MRQMETKRYKGEEIHVGCGGVVTGRTCLKCGEKKTRRGIGELVFGTGPLIGKESKEVGREEHRRRIREGRDISKR